MDCSLTGFSVHGILQARILEWVAISFSRDLPDPGIKPMSPELASGFFTTGIPDWEAPVYEITPVNKNKDVLIRKFIAM